VEFRLLGPEGLLFYWTGFYFAMKYYLHDTNAMDDEKVSELFMKFGYEGVGLFYVILEKLGKQEKPVKTEVLKAQLKVGKRLEKCWSFMEQIGIISSNNGETFNKQLLNFSEKYQIKKEKTREKVSQWRKKQDDKESVTSYVPVSNLPKVKESKVKESKVNIKRQFIPPLLSEVKTYFEENGYKNEIAIRAFNYYSTANWRDSKGNPVKNWKQKMIAVWFKDENKIIVNNDDLEYKQLREKLYGKQPV
jgi:hypothetical protein